MPVRLAPPIHLSLFQTYNPAQHFHGVAADANVGDALTVARCAHKDFTRSSSLDALADENLLIRFRKAMPHDPTDGATRSRSRGRIFSAIEEHAGANLAPVLACFGRNKVTETSARSLPEAPWHAPGPASSLPTHSHHESARLQKAVLSTRLGSAIR